MNRKRNIQGFIKPKNIGLGLQIYHVSRRFHGFKFYRNNDEEYWLGKLTPTEKSNTYTVKINYLYKKVPKVYVIEPQILRNSPHIYPDKSLCLYYPKDFSFDKKTSLIADTIIPWTAEWLYFYEIWMETGIWWGNEAPHTVSNLANKKGEFYSVKLG
ncbi:hypothetical protein ACMXKO_10175 [Clostridium tyrobutyricum]|uniref:hypothetical protein n=1 Tax=Clostridium tyrobutyricum TaxID=1519 RepID=UPI0039F6F169